MAGRGDPNEILAAAEGSTDDRPALVQAVAQEQLGVRLAQEHVE